MCRKRSGEVLKPRVPANETHEFFPVKDSINEAFGGYYVALPPRYSERIDSFPLLIFLHGLGQAGNGNSELEYLKFDGIGKLIDGKKFPVSFSYDGKLHSFIVVSPQSSREARSEEVKQLRDQIITTYRADTSRIYLAGLSMGARSVTFTAGDYPNDFAAVVPIAGVGTGAGMRERCRRIAEAGLPVWELHNADDPMADVSLAEHFIQMLTEFSPKIKPRLTIFDVYGHDAWTTALDPDYRENGMNIYEWMLRYSRK